MWHVKCAPDFTLVPCLTLDASRALSSQFVISVIFSPGRHSIVYCAISGLRPRRRLRRYWVLCCHKQTSRATKVSFMTQYFLQADLGRRRQRRDLSQHFTINTFSIDKRTHNYIKNVTEQCIIHHADLDLTNTICHNVFTCKVSTVEVIYLLKVRVNLGKRMLITIPDWWCRPTSMFKARLQLQPVQNFAKLVEEDCNRRDRFCQL